MTKKKETTITIHKLNGAIILAMIAGLLTFILIRDYPEQSIASVIFIIITAILLVLSIDQYEVKAKKIAGLELSENK